MDDLIFNAEKHEYRVGERVIPSVTQALSLIDDRPKDPWYLQRGTFVHLACELFDKGELDEESLDPAIVPYLISYKTFLTETGFKPQLIEARRFHSRYFYAGTMDRIGDIRKKSVLIDIKSGAPASVDELQLAGYWELIREEIQVCQCFDLYLRDDGGMPKLIEVKKPRLLLPTFLACLTIYQWKEFHR